MCTEIERATLPTQPTSSTWKRLGKTKSKPGQITTQNRIFYQLSTPAMQKSTSRFVYNRQTTTTIDPRISLAKDIGHKNNDLLNEKNSAFKKIDVNRVCLISCILYVTIFSIM